MDRQPSRRQYLATLGVAGIAGVAGCSQSDSEQTATPTRNLGGANFTFEYESGAQQVTIQYNGGATIQAGNLQVRSSSGSQTAWSQLGSTTTGADAQLGSGATAVLGEDILNWGQAVGPNETIRLVFAAGNGPSTLGRFTPTESSTLTSTVPSTPTPESTETQTEEPDTTAPSITAFSLSNPSGQELRISFESDEDLASIEVNISGAETATLTTGEFGEAISGGTYTYEATYQASSDGDYTATLNEAVDRSGNNGASGQSVSLTVGSSSTTGTVVVDDFEDTGELNWAVDSGTRDRLEFSTEAAQGSYSLHFLQVSGDTSTNISRSLTSPQSPSEFSLWFRYESSYDNNFRIQLHNSDGTKILEFREFSGSIHYRDPTERGEYVPHSDIAQVEQNTWYKLAIENIDFSNYTFDATVYDTNDSVVNNVEEVGFWTESDEITEIRIFDALGDNGQPDPLWIDNVTYIQ